MTYTWSPALLHDVEPIVNLAIQHFQTEIDSIFIPSPHAYSRNLAYAVLNQHYHPNTELLSVARAPDNQLLAYNWVKANERHTWSDDLITVVRMVHIDLTLSPRLRIQLVKDMMLQWEQLALAAKNPVVHSTTMRTDSTAFMRLHEQAGYTVRNNSAYKRITPM
jgi:hypothetical protein